MNLPLSHILVRELKGTVAPLEKRSSVMSTDTQTERRMQGQIIRKMLRNRVVGKSHKKQLETVVEWFPASEEEEVRELLKEMVRDPELPVESYGQGPYSNIFIPDYDEAKKFIASLDLDTEWL